MNNFIKHINKTQMWAIIVTVILLITMLALLFGKSSNNNYTEIKNELQIISESIRANYNKKPDYWGLNNQHSVTFLPKKYIHNNKIISSVGREYIIGQNQNGDMVMPSQRTFMITLNNLSKRACKEIALLKIENDFGLQKIIIKNTNHEINFEWGGKYTLPVSSDNANIYCENKNSISWIFD